MAGYILRRLAWTPILLLTVTLITFLLGSYGPGDPVELLQGQYSNPEVVQRIREQRGLDRNIFVQYVHYVQSAVTGDLGESFKYRDRTVKELISKRIWVSAQLGMAASLISILIGIPLGVYVALKQGTWVDITIVSITLFFMSLPVFITAPFPLIFFGNKFAL